MGQRKKSPCEEWNLRPLDSMLRCSTTEPQRLNGEQGLLWSVKSKALRFNSSWGLRIFSLCHTCDKTKNIFLYFFTELKTYHLSNFYLKTLRYQHCLSYQYAGRVSYELHNQPHSQLSLCNPVVEHQSTVSEALRFNSSWELRIFSLSHTHDKTKNIFL